MSERAQPFNLAPGLGRVLPTPAGGQVTFKVRAEESSAGFSVLEFEVPAGAGPRPHVHEEREEFIYVLEGGIRIQLGDAKNDAPTGSCIFIPRGLLHGFRNVEDRRARLLAVYQPGGIEEFFEEFAAGAASLDRTAESGNGPLPGRPL